MLVLAGPWEAAPARHRCTVTLIALLAVLALPLGSGAQELNRFENGEVADAEEVNENFQILLQRIEALEAAIGSLDADGDGFTAADGDCDDSNRDVFPGAPEVCDDLDNDCSGVVDDGDADLSCSGLDSPCGTGLCLAGGSCGAVPASAGAVCRATAGPCDLAEVCDGVSTECPADVVRPSGFLCRSALGDCDVAEFCTGASGACPADAVRSSGFVCRTAAGPCDVAETCSGASPSCPINGFRPASFVCRAATSACDGAELCTGSSPSCPPDPGCVCTPPEQDCGGFCAVLCP